MADHAVNIAAVLPALGADFVLQERTVPSPGPDEITVRNHVVAVNPVDWKRQQWGLMISSFPTIIGLDVSGVVTQVGPFVTRFKPGDRVFGLAGSSVSGNVDHAAFQTYMNLGVLSTAALPPSMSFHEGATLATAINTAMMALYDVLELPLPASDLDRPPQPSPSSQPTILIWGGASSAGSMTIQLARLSGLRIFTTASAHHHDYLRSLGASVVVDYHSPTAVDDLLRAADEAGTRITRALDAISKPETLAPVMEVLAKSVGIATPLRLAHLVPWPENFACVEGITICRVAGEEAWNRRRDLCDWLFKEHIEGWLKDGLIVPFRYRVIPGGLGGLQNALNELKGGVSGEKLVVEV